MIKRLGLTVRRHRSHPQHQVTFATRTLISRTIENQTVKTCIRTENQNQESFSPFGPHEISVLIELTLGHLRYHLTDVPHQSAGNR